MENDDRVDGDAGRPLTAPEPDTTASWPLTGPDDDPSVIASCLTPQARDLLVTIRDAPDHAPLAIGAASYSYAKLLQRGLIAANPGGPVLTSTGFRVAARLCADPIADRRCDTPTSVVAAAEHVLSGIGRLEGRERQLQAMCITAVAVGAYSSAGGILEALHQGHDAAEETDDGE